MNLLRARFVFQDNVSNTGNGTKMNVDQASKMYLQFDATSTFKAVVEGTINGTSYFTIGTIIQMDDLTVVSEVTDATKLYQVSIEALVDVRVKITENDGLVTVFGRVYN